MFARENANMPKDPEFPLNLEELGFKVNEEGKFVQISNPSKAPPRYVKGNADGGRTNDVYLEAVNMCARKAVADGLAEFGVKKVYLKGADGAQVAEGKPKDKHISIFTTDLKELKGKRDVLIVIGEHTQDMGIWSYRHLKNEGGVDEGSAVGLVKKIQVLSLTTKPQLPGTETPEQGGIKTDAAWGFQSKERMDSVVTLNKDDIPGVIILNPGQLLYSHELNKVMSLNSWYARAKCSAVGGTYVINDNHNKMPGHKNAKEHVYTIFDHVLPKLIDSKAKLFVIGITDGAENFINYMQARTCAGKDAPCKPDGPAAQVKTMAFMNPTHDPLQLQCKAIEELLEYHGFSWIKSSKPKGKFINSPKALKPIEPHYLDEGQATEAGVTEEDELEASTGNLTGSAGVLVSRAGNEMPPPYTEAGPLAGSAPTEILQPTQSDHEHAARLRAEGEASLQPALSPNTVAARRESLSLRDSLEALALDSSLSNSAAAFTRVGADWSDAAIPNSGEENPSSVFSDMAESYDYTDVVSCPTFSGATDIDEMILPNVLDLALEKLSGRK